MTQLPARHLALADRPEEAAAIFGPLHDDVVLAGYADAAHALRSADGTEVDGALLDSVGLVAGEGLEPALRRALEWSDRAGPEAALTILLGLPADLSGIEQVRALAGDLGLALATETTGEDGVVLRVRRGADPVPEAPWDPPALPRPQAARPAAPAGSAPEVAAEATPPPSSPVPRLVLAAALGTAVVAVVAVVLAVTAGVAVAALVLLVVLVVGLGATGLLLLLVLRRTAALERRLEEQLPTREQDRERTRLLRQVHRRTDRLLEAQRRQSRRIDALQSGVDELAGTREQVAALAALTSRTAARDRS